MGSTQRGRPWNKSSATTVWNKTLQYKFLFGVLFIWLPWPFEAHWTDSGSGSGGSIHSMTLYVIIQPLRCSEFVVYELKALSHLIKMAQDGKFNNIINPVVHPEWRLIVLHISVHYLLWVDSLSEHSKTHLYLEAAEFTVWPVCTETAALWFPLKKKLGNGKWDGNSLFFARVMSQAICWQGPATGNQWRLQEVTIPSQDIVQHITQHNQHSRCIIIGWGECSQNKRRVFAFCPAWGDEVEKGTS